jgi:hypothetical protein
MDRNTQQKRARSCTRSNPAKADLYQPDMEIT